MISDDSYGAPVEVGDVLDVRINRLGSKEDGIAYVQGFVVFVPETNIGDEVKIKVEMVKQSFARAKVVK